MQYQTFSDTLPDAFPIALLAPKLNQDAMRREYIDPACINEKEVIAYSLHKDGKKTPASIMREYLDELTETLDELGCEYLVVGDGDYFKALTGVNKADPYLGYVLPNSYPQSRAGRFQVLYVPNYRQVFYDPARTKAKIKQGMDALWDHRHGRYRDPGCEIISFSAYPSTLTDIAAWLQKLLDMDCDLTCDTEAFSLKHHDAGIGTIGFAWNQHEGISFAVDYVPLDEPQDGFHGYQAYNAEVRKLLVRFFREFKHTMTWHNISYDACVMIYQLFMDNLIDQKGLLDGLEVMMRKFDDTKIISYLATNSCAGNSLGLKDQSQEFSGNYAQEEIKDIRKIPLPELLQYNLVDCLSTWFVKKKHWDTMVADQQLELYEELMKPSLIDIVQMQLTGMPLDMEEVKKTKAIFEEDRADAIRKIQAEKLVKEFSHLLNEEAEQQRYQDWCDRKKAGVKVRPYTPGKNNLEFNPNSTPQKQRLFYEVLGLPVLERTKTKQPATGGDVLEKLKAYTENPDIKALIDAFLVYGVVDKLYGTFIPPMENAVLASDGRYYLFGNFNLGGTVSGRLSSSDPNLQTIPSKKNKHAPRDYAKLIKKCFVAPKGQIMIGLDFASLEDRISALTTKDPNKLKVYTDGFDGHCLRAQSYFAEDMPEIDPTSVESINSVAKEYPVQRQESKVPTFLLTYQGTYIGMMAQCDFTEEKARKIEARYHELYKVSDDWVDAQLQEATKTGYVTCAFGLRVRTPLLAQVVRGTSRTPHEAEAEGRTAGNALGQSWCLLNSRASVEFMRKVRAHPVYRYLVRPIAHIHDAQYYLIPDDLELLRWVNEHLVKAVEWQDHPDIWHDEVKLGGNLSIFYPSWAQETEIPNGATEEQILDLVEEKIAA